MTHSFSMFVSVATFTVVAAFAVGCAAPSAQDEGQSSEDLSSATDPSTSALGSAGGGVTDPLCIEHTLHASTNACVLDATWRARAEQICASEHKKVESFEIVKACGATPTPASGGQPEPASNAGSASGSAGSPPSDPSVPSTTAGASATEVSVACCNYGVEPPVHPGSSILKPSAAASLVH